MRYKDIFIISLILSYSPCSWKGLLSFFKVELEEILGKGLETNISLLISLPEYTDLPLEDFPYFEP
jgi:hypothetical protein|nr:MAG TPA: hypothetical protein [Caudoviricetes sp.]DAW30798.1 MAG TPA: hypothetical protein [Caudoviricetes sp.]